LNSLLQGAALRGGLLHTHHRANARAIRHGEHSGAGVDAGEPEHPRETGLGGGGHQRGQFVARPGMCAAGGVPRVPCGRLFLSHFGFLGFETRNPHNPAEALGNPPQRPLIVLDTKSTAFAADLDRLDKLSARTHDTVYVFYVKVT